MNNTLTSGRARTARPLCVITFHFVATRISFLAEVLRSLSEFAVAAMDVVIVTNTLRQDDLSLLHRLCAEILSGKNGTVHGYGDLPHPFDLTWCHKAIIANEFANGNNGRYTHFIYLEDDIRLSFANFCYFTEFREALRGFGLLPSFVRVEWSAALCGFVASDAFWQVYLPVQTHVRLGDTAMVNMPNPYNPCFILDVELAEEYVHSRSFDRAASGEVCSWGVRERAAMGLCLENVPPPFQSRYVVPVSMQTDMVPSVARISHLPNSYADDPHMPLGKIRIDSLFKGARTLVNGDWWPSRERGGDGGSRGAAPSDIGAGTLDEVASYTTGAASTRPQNTERISQDRYYLISHHDTILYVDEAAQRLRHRPFGIAPLNLVLEFAGPRGHLIFLENDLPGHRKLSFALSTGEIRWLSDSTDPNFQIESFADGSIGLCTGELYVAGDLDGMVRNDRTWCAAFEQFRLVRTDTFDGLAILQRHTWISHRYRQIVTLAPQPIDFGREVRAESSALAATLAAGAIELRRDIVFGPTLIRLVGRSPQIAFDGTNDADPNGPLDVFITDATGTRYGFSRLKS